MIQAVCPECATVMPSTLKRVLRFSSHLYCLYEKQRYGEVSTSLLPACSVCGVCSTASRDRILAHLIGMRAIGTPLIQFFPAQSCFTPLG